MAFNYMNSVYLKRTSSSIFNVTENSDSTSLVNFDSSRQKLKFFVNSLRSKIILISLPNI